MRNNFAKCSICIHDAYSKQIYENEKFSDFASFDMNILECKMLGYIKKRGQALVWNNRNLFSFGFMENITWHK